MKNTHYAIAAIALFGTSVLIGCTANSENLEKTEKSAVKSEEAIIKRGEYLVGIMGCQDCHSPKRMGAQGPEIIPELHLSGHPADHPIGKVVPEALKNGWMLFGPDGTASVGPWGVSFSANLTSDATGIGTWSYEQFKTALTQGKSKGLATARPLLPPMPWVNYTNMAEEDIEAVFKYLKSTKPVKNAVPAPIPPDKLAQL
ncbi:c-type cytochrome [Runella aurantiaca]|uniref:Diheme cytochrome c-553 n=1 Tax=Runella aurantiaca TaxID=2282308 RepID=A0A369HY16_9BACT|nr:c-type cytochrome [Runella aurantiaca]RDB02421.1 diheme cytochrome c-553 [Runella aurantiaca]